MYPSFVIVHYAGRVCTGFTTFNCFFCFLFYCSSIVFTPLVSRVTCTSAFLLQPPGRVWCYGNGNTVACEGQVQPRPQAPLLLRRHRTQGIMGRNTVQTSRHTTQAIQLYSFPSLSCLLSVDCSLNCSLRRPINHFLLLLFAHFLGKI